MKITFAFAVSAVLACAACKKASQQAAADPNAAPAAQAPAPAADNSATRYVSSLQQDVQKADAVAKKMNASIQQTSGEVNQAEQAH